jgi:biopolymer transport protein ExbD
MVLGQRRKRTNQFAIPKLQITAMMDMFTIILIFLLFSFSDRPETMTIDKDLELPESQSKMDYRETIKLVLSPKNLKLENKVIARLENGQIIGLHPDKVEESVLYKELRQYRAKNDIPATGEKREAPILFLCDKRVPFKTINRIVKTAGLAGFPDFQFAVLKK